MRYLNQGGNYMSENTNNTLNEEIKYEKLSDDELEVIGGGKSHSRGGGPALKLYHLCKGDVVYYKDGAGNNREALITRIEWEGWNPMINILLTDTKETMRVHPSTLIKGARF